MNYRTVAALLFSIVFLSGCAFFEHDEPAASFTWTPVSPSAFTPVVFVAVSHEDVLRWQWDFGDGNTGEGQRVMYQYGEPGEYTVTLEIVDEYGRRAVRSKMIVVK